MIRNTLLLASAIAAAASPALAQDFLGRLGRAAAERAAAGAISRAVSGAAASATAPATASPAPARERGPAPSSSLVAPAAASQSNFAAPAPINFSAQLASPRQLRFSEEDTAGKKRLEEFSRYDCTACEGGRAYGSWVGHHVSSLFANGLNERVSRMAVGEKVDWQVAAMGGSGRMEVVSAQPIGPWACKQIRWTITRGTRSESRPGLFCEYGGRWYEVL